MKRRKFVKKAGAGVLATSATPLLWGNSKKWKGANDRVNIGVVGIRGMGQNHIKSFSSLNNVSVAAICDIDEKLFAERIQKHFTDKGISKPQKYADMRRMYEDKDLDAVTVVTPNHWHTLAAIWAIQAGKHVTVEKPCCHTFFEGQQLVKAAKKSGLVVQDGAEQRSNPCAISASEFLHKGGLGEVYLAKGLCYKWRDTIGSYPDEPVPEGVNYDLWLGPAPQRPFNQNRFHYNWHWHWDYGNGDMGNQGVHEMDVARWGLNVKLPTKVSAIGGHFMFEDAQETPNTLMAIFEFDNPDGKGDKKKILQFEVRHWISNQEGYVPGQEGESGGYMQSASNTIGNLFYGSEGYMTKTVNKWQTFMGKEKARGPAGEGLGDHYQNFIDAIRANDPGVLNTTVEEGFYSCALIHLANISYRLGRSLDFDPVKQIFVDDNEANRMLTKEYRSPYVVPEVV